MAARRRARSRTTTFTDEARKRTDLLLQDLLDRAKGEPAVGAALSNLYQAEKKQGRTGETESQWRRLRLTQIAAAWVLSCTFVRTLEDRGLLARARIASEDGAATDSEQQFEHLFPFLGPADYLLAVFRELQRFPGLQDVFDRSHNPVWHLAPSPGAVRELLGFFRERTEEGPLRWTFAIDDPSKLAETRFLGDLYQDLNTDVQKRYALLQTPDFVEELILEETLDPAIERFGLAETKVLDPTCGSGHFLLGAFQRLHEAWQKQAPGLDRKQLVQKALSQVYGADINPYAVAIARFRLVLAATVAARIARLDADDVPHWPVHLCICNSLLVRDRANEQQLLQGEGFQLKRDDAVLAYELANPAEVDAVFKHRFEAVVGNPPYITEKDPTVRDAIRERYESAAGKYALAAPFTERFFQLACEGGFVGMINSNAWTKREFGKALIEKVLPHYRLNLVVDTSGAYVPGHGTPTLLLFGQSQEPNGAPVRTVQGKRGEPSTPEDPVHGLVWSSIREHRNEVGFENDFVSVVETERATFRKHPWSLGGGGAADLKEILEGSSERQLKDVVSLVGVVGMTNADDVMLAPAEAFARRRVEETLRRRLVLGDQIRDWKLEYGDHVLFPYIGEKLVSIGDHAGLMHWLWPYRTTMGSRATFGGSTYFAEGRPWWEWHQVALERLRTPLSIAFAFVATHNHFVLDRGGKVFKQSAPVIKLKPEATEDDHLALLGLLNSSVAGFWMKQVCHCKGAEGIASGHKSERWEMFHEFTGTKLESFPLPDSSEAASLAARLDELVARIAGDPLGTTADEWSTTRATLFSLQEELDWACYRIFSLTDQGEALLEANSPPPLALGERAFEIVLARRLQSGVEHSAWFDRHGSLPITEIPSHWPEPYREVVQHRIDLIESDRNIGLIETPEYKRRWNVEPWEQQVERAQRLWLRRRLESEAYWPTPDSPNLRPLPLTQLADRATQDPEFHQMAVRLRGSDNFDVETLVAEIALPEAVPVQSACRYRPTGIEKRHDWEHTWDLQRAEDRGEAVGEIPVPPKYKAEDFQKSDYWRNRGKLDVPKETFLLYAHCGKQGEALLGWAGWDHLQQIRALTNLYQQRKDEDGWDTTQLLPILVAMAEVLPWVEQWHNEPDPVHGTKNGDAFRAYLDEELRRHNLTRDGLRDWRP